MANIKVTSKCSIYDGMSITFKAPCDCTAIQGLTVTDNTATKTFTFKDTHGNTLTGIENLFSQGAYIKVVLDTTNNYAYIQNGDSNGYLENKLNSLTGRLDAMNAYTKQETLTSATKALFGKDVSAVPDDIFQILSNGVFKSRTRKIAGELPVGSVVSIPVGGVPHDFIVVQQGKPSNVYDDSCNGTWLMMKNIYTSAVFDIGTGNNAPADSFMKLDLERMIHGFDIHVRSAIKNVKIPYASGNGHTATNVNTGSNGLSAQLFLLSGTEVGCSSSSMSTEGAKLAYFNTDATNRRIAYYSGAATKWWTRSPFAKRGDYVFTIDTNGSLTYTTWNATCGIRPAFVISSDFDFSIFEPLVDATGGEIMIDGSQVLNREKISIGSYTGAGRYSSSGSTSTIAYPVNLTFEFVPKAGIIWGSGFVGLVTSNWGILFSKNDSYEFNLYEPTVSVSDTTMTLSCDYWYLKVGSTNHVYTNMNHNILNTAGSVYNYIIWG